MDLLSNRITVIRNGQKSSRRHVVCRISNKNIVTFEGQTILKHVTSCLDLLCREGYIRAYSFSEEKTSGLNLKIYLKYDSNGKSVIRSIFRVSTPGRRSIVSARSFWQPETTAGIYVISTSQGIMTDVEVRLHNLGGEILFGVT